MQVSVEVKEGLERVVSVVVPAANVDTKVDQRVVEVAQKARIDGYRPGKVPVSVIKQRFGKSIREEVIGDVIKETLPKAFESEDIQPAGFPQIDPAINEKGKDFTYTATFEVYPEITLNTLNDVTVDKMTAEINDADMDEMMKRIQEQHAEWSEVDRAAKEGDQVVIDFVGYLDGEKFQGGEANDYPLELGSKSMIPGFEDGLLKAKAGQEVELNVTFPEEYHSADLAGKPVVFKTTVKKVNEKSLPELDAEFAKTFDIEDGDLDKLRAEIRESMQRELEQKLIEINKKTVFDQWLEKNDVQLPNAMVDSEIQSMQQEMIQRMTGGQDFDVSQLPEFPRDMFEDQAKRRVTLGLLVREFVKQKELKPDNKKVQETLETMARAYERPQDVIAWYHGSKDRMAQIESKVLEDQVVEVLLADAKVAEVNKSYQDVMNHRPEADQAEE